MKHLLLSLLFLSFIFSSCEKDEDKNSLFENLSNAKIWDATRFEVKGENTMSPDSSDILDDPITYVNVKFLSKTKLTIQIEMVDFEGYKDNSEALEMDYIISETDSVLSITDNNWWTESASFTGNHKIESLINDNLILSGKMGTLPYKMFLKRQK